MNNVDFTTVALGLANGRPLDAGILQTLLNARAELGCSWDQYREALAVLASIK